MKTLYFDCFAGASGNMILGALVDLGVEQEVLAAGLKGLSVSGFSVETNRVDRAGVTAIYADVKYQEQRKHRHLHHIEELISTSELSDTVKLRACSIFRRLAAAEAKVHGIDIQKVHFHEVGALDAIVDVVGSCIGFELLGIDRFVCSKVHVGSGFVTMEHGKYPVPPPAVANLLSGVPAYSTEISGELMTPTGAAIITTLCKEYGPIPEMTIENTGYGAGSREYKDFPNVLRLIVGEMREGPEGAGPAADLLTEDLVLLETNVDDVAPQVIGFVSERALELGALDCWVTPVQMKKNRPGAVISVLCRDTDRSEMLKLLFAETTTLGIRSSRVQRVSLPREFSTVDTAYGKIDVKIAEYAGEAVNLMPEYEQVKSAALKHGVPFRAVHQAVLEALRSEAMTAVS